MTLYNVHIYREMRLYFPCVEAATPEEAARIAAERLTEDAEYTEDCQGENLAALVDVVGDRDFEHSVTIDFDAERLRRLAPGLREALALLATAAEDLDAAIDGVTDQFDAERQELLTACRNARATIAMATDQATRRPA